MRYSHNVRNVFIDTMQVTHRLSHNINQNINTLKKKLLTEVVKSCFECPLVLQWEHVGIQNVKLCFDFDSNEYFID